GDNEQARRGAQRRGEGRRDCVEGKRLFKEADNDRHQRADRTGLRCRKQADEHTAEHDAEKNKDRPYFLQRGDFIGPGRLIVNLWRKFRVNRHADDNHQDVGQGRRDTYANRRDEQSIDRRFRENTEKDQKDARRDQGPEGSSRGNRARRKARRIIIFHHLGDGDSPHRSRAGDTRPRNGRKTRTSKDGRDGQPARQPGKPYPRRREKPGCQPAVMRHKAHQQEHRNGGQGPLRREGIRDNRQDSPRLLRPEYEADSHKRHGDQSNRNRDAQQQQSDYSRKADQPDNFTFHGLPSPASSYFFDYRPRFNASA